ncbi:trypsin-like peptidase domain-containing protein [Streptomyces sp. RB6PN25]|uniref:Trypsin-like peptidase domain-containing protein n=1 Tax=Streptomyces humicola TaxID=2953240 RepID=A0ABT1Q3W4_9ACTN|nr:trypsin-like peptidase domain-containing protein [Streptomyces humicola]MCQ4084604.1 trypsin-like peptidase domain-containing protein [Streptomyces humicola]
MTDSNYPSSGSQQPGGPHQPHQPQQPHQPYADPWATQPQRPAQDPWAHPSAQAQPLGAPERPAKARKPVALLAAVAIVSGLIGGGTAALIANSTHTTSTDTSAVVTPTSSKSGGSIAAVAAAVSPSIVEITADSASDESIGSGVILSSDGTILTNNHVIAGADTIKITFSNGNTANAKVVGTDSTKDLAVVKAEGVSGLKPAALGNSDAVAVGDQVVAIGSPDGLAGTVTSGVVSALGRDVTVPVETGNSGGGYGGRSGNQWPFSFGGGQYNGQVGGNTTTYKAIQTDASLNPGNSGGALINTAGQVIGINSAMYSPNSSSYSSGSSNAGSVGLGFAIPINTAKADLNSLENGSNT